MPQYSYNTSTVASAKSSARDSPKRGFSNRQQKTKPMSPDEWLRKLEAENWNPNDDDEEETLNNINSNGSNADRGDSKKTKKKKRSEVDDLQGIIYLKNIF